MEGALEGGLEGGERVGGGGGFLLRAGEARFEGGNRGEETVETEVKLGRIRGGRRGQGGVGGGRRLQVLAERLEPLEDFGGGVFGVCRGGRIVRTGLLEIALDSTEFLAERCVFLLEMAGERGNGYGNLVDLLLQMVIFAFERVAQLFDFQLVSLCDFYYENGRNSHTFRFLFQLGGRLAYLLLQLISLLS